MRWLEGSGDGVLLFTREPGFLCVVNLSPRAVPLPIGDPLIASFDLTEDGQLPVDAAAWLQTAPDELTASLEGP